MRTWPAWVLQQIVGIVLDDGDVVPTAHVIHGALPTCRLCDSSGVLPRGDGVEDSWSWPTGLIPRGQYLARVWMVQCANTTHRVKVGAVQALGVHVDGYRGD